MLVLSRHRAKCASCFSTIHCDAFIGVASAPLEVAVTIDGTPFDPPKDKELLEQFQIRVHFDEHFVE